MRFLNCAEMGINGAASAAARAAAGRQTGVNTTGAIQDQNATKAKGLEIEGARDVSMQQQFQVANAPTGRTLDLTTGGTVNRNLAYAGNVGDTNIINASLTTGGTVSENLGRGSLANADQPKDSPQAGA